MALKNIAEIKMRVKYLEHRDLVRNLNRLVRHGALPTRKADEVWAIREKIKLGHDDPFEGIQVTKHGESRIKHCIKYDLNDGYRLVTIKEKKQVLLCFVGTHDDSEKWLDKNKGLTLVAIPQNQLNHVDSVITKYDFEDSGMPKSNDRLVDQLPKEYKKQLFKIAGDAYVEISELTFSANLERIKDLCKEITNSESAENVSSVLCAVKNGDMANATKQLDLLNHKIKEIGALDESEFLKIQDGEQIKEIKIGSHEYTEIVKKIIESPHYQDWMLFMHPEQQKIVDKDFIGAALLSGVSGSGKTCIVVKRAIRLAKATNSNVLVLTLNPGLARLISELLDYASGGLGTSNLVEVKSFPDLCSELLFEFEPDNWKQYKEKTWKTNEHVDEVWREFYRCQANNSDAEILFSLHKSLIARNIDAETYIRQEFDWIRSLSISGRDTYLTADRIGRTIGLDKGGADRRNLLAGVNAWEKKLWEVGVSDYLNLSTALYRHINEIQPRYKHVLVDEAQDFGTIELRLIRAITMEGGNNLFFAGDIAQTILPKHHDFTAAGVTFSRTDRLTLKKNYRNSKEILHAAYDVIMHSIDKLEYVFDSKDLEILDPDYANRHSNIPCILDGGNLADEISYALKYAFDYDQSKKICLCFAGYSLLELNSFSKKYDIPVLDGDVPLAKSKIFVSDLEQMKGFEFDCVVILNCSGNVIPNPYLPIEESFRDISRLYVAMTRAKTDLIVSFSTNPSGIFEKSIGNCSFYRDHWEEFHDKTTNLDIEIPQHLPQFDVGKFSNISKLDGKAFLYTDQAIGLPKDLIDKIETLVDGIGRSNKKHNTRWRTMGAAYADVRTTPSAKTLFGPKTHRDFLDFYEKLQTSSR